MTSAIALIHTGCKTLGIDEDGRRAIYDRITGKPKLTLMSAAEKDAVVVELRRLGFKSDARRPNGKRKLTGKFAPKLQALWIAGWNLGIVQERDDAALEAFVRRQTGLEAVRFCHDPSDARSAIEGLKRWIARESGLDWAGDYRNQPDAEKIARAQWAILSPASARDFWKVATDLIDQDETHRNLTTAEWIRVMNLLGDRVRKAKAVRS